MGQATVRVVKVALTLLALPMFVLAVALWVPQIRNNMKLNAFSEQLFSYPLPEGTVVLERSRRVGLHGNGDHCDFSAAQVIETELSLQEVELYYSVTTFLPAGGRNEGQAAGYETAPLTLQVSPLTSSDSEERRRLVLALFDAGHPPGWDLRCH